MSEKKEFIKDIDYYVEDGRVIFTEAYNLKRGSCCGNDCKHCAYSPRSVKGNKDIKS
jgi:biotin synthase-like enzyme|tara:strand:- start:562 stop:732 length:171 start_codon:yes stop_codon:yes gene_type:complete